MCLPCKFALPSWPRLLASLLRYLQAHKSCFSSVKSVCTLRPEINAVAVWRFWGSMGVSVPAHDIRRRCYARG